MKTKTLKFLIAALFLSACQPFYAQEISPKKAAENANDSIAQKVVYGDDDRIDFFQIMDPAWQSIASSTVALVPSSSMTEKADEFEIQTRHYGDSYGLCDEEPFFEQPTAAFCSGSLIGDDIIVTAGHCITSQDACEDTNFVFGFAYEAAGVAPKTASKDNVYNCKKVIHTEVVGFQGSDFAIIQLDRPVVGHTPLKVRETGTIGDNDELTVIGHPAGLPTKLAGGASVRDNLNADYFIANLDTYGGNSGSAVLNTASLEVEGILVRGEADYVYTGGCRLSNVCANDGCRGEDVTRIGKIFDHITVDDLKPQALRKNERTQ